MNVFSSSPSLSRWSILFAAVSAFLLVGCAGSAGTSSTEASSSAETGSSDPQSAEASTNAVPYGPVPYQVGKPLPDSTVAMVVSSGYGTDTLQARPYRRAAKKRLRRLSPEQRTPDTLRAIHRSLVRRFAEKHVVQGEATAENIAIDSSALAARLRRVKNRYGSEKQLRQSLAKRNMTLDSLRNYLARQLQMRALRQKMKNQAREPTDEELEAYSRKHRRIRVQHILIRVGQSAPQSKVDSARRVAAALLDSVKAGADFAELARRRSEGPSAEEGGDLGYIRRDQMVDAFSKAAFALADSGAVAPEPVRTRYGFHVIQLTDEGKPMKTAKARKQLMKKRRKQALQQGLAALLQKATVRVHPEIVQASLYEK